MGSASIFRYPSLRADTNPGVIHTGLTNVKIVHIRPLLVGVGNRRLENLVNYAGSTLSRKLQNVYRILHASTDYQLRNQPGLTRRNRSITARGTPIGKIVFLDSQSRSQATNVIARRLGLEQAFLPVPNRHASLFVAKTRPGDVTGQLRNIDPAFLS
jgi:hypothetical protein